MVPKLEEVYEFRRRALPKAWLSGEGQVPLSLAESGAEEYFYEEGLWIHHDRYYGGRSFFGREIVKHDGVLVWCLNYHGHLVPEDADPEIYAFLKEALRAISDTEFPFRGPQQYAGKRMIYFCHYEWEDEIYFNGREGIRRQDEMVYRGYFHGGPIRP